MGYFSIIKQLHLVGWLLAIILLPGCIHDNKNNDPLAVSLMENRELLNAKELGNGMVIYPVGQPIQFNTEYPNATIPLSLSGMSLHIPYNSKWGNEKYSIDPYYIRKDGNIVFGPVDYCEGGQPCRNLFIAFTKIQSEEELLDELNARYLKAVDIYSAVTQPHKIHLSSIDAIEFGYVGMCDALEWHIPIKETDIVLSACDNQRTRYFFKMLVDNLNLNKNE